MGIYQRPREVIDNKPGSSYTYPTVLYDRYDCYHKGYAQGINDEVIVGIQDCFEPRSIDFHDGYLSFLGLVKEGHIKTEPIDRTDLNYEWIRQAWAKNAGVKFSLGQLKDRSSLIEVIEICNQENPFPFFNETHDDMLPSYLALCEKYGLLLFQDKSSAMATGSKELVNPKDRWLHYGFSVRALTQSIGYIYSLYLLWCFLFYGDERAKDRFSEIGAFSADIDKPRGINKFLMVSSMYSGVKRIPAYHDGDVITENRCANFVGAVCQQMIDLFGLGLEGLEGKTLFRCKNCGNEFVRTRSNSTLCESCRANSAKVAAHRARKKQEEAQANAEKEREQ